MIIYGAGLAGLLAGCIFPTARIQEAAPPNTTGHKALLRFRSRVVGDAIGIDFRPVCVRKGIWHQGAFREPSIQLANWYARKATGSLMDRSIWDLSSVERWIAPESLIDQLLERCLNRTTFEAPLLHMPSHTEPCISTIPMATMAHLAGAEAPPTFHYQPIAVKRWRIKNADVFQTVYVPDPATTLYRVSITGNLVIAEYMEKVDDYDFWRAFGLYSEDAEPLETTRQRFGKIAPIDELWRRHFIFDLTTKHNVYSVGRFATWRNILLDDVIKDISVVKRLMASGSAYARLRHSVGGAR